MNCPVCKCPNTPGATHCSMCYEVFNRSAADAHLRTVRRERLMHEHEIGRSSDIPDLPTESFRQSVDRVKEVLPSVDWENLSRQTWSGAKRFKNLIFLIAGIWAVIILWMALRSPSFWMSAVGGKFDYQFSDKKPVRYLSSFTSEFKSWSARNNQMDTPLEDFRGDELGNLTLQRKTVSKKEWQVVPSVKEWIVIRRDADSITSRSVTIPLQHPSLKGGPVIFNSQGRVIRREYPPNPRVGRSLHFIVPELPRKRLKKGQRWSQSVSWVEQVGAWKFFWSGKVDWLVKDNAASDGSVTFVGRPSLKPQIWEGPSWASGAFKQLQFQPTASSSELTFDGRHGRLASSSLVYQGTLNFPIDDLDRIPYELRIGRRVRGPGRVFLQLKNRIDIRQN